MIGRESSIWHHDFREAPIIRRTLEECDQIAHLRGIVYCLEAALRDPPRPGSAPAEYYATCARHLDELGLTLEE